MLLSNTAAEVICNSLLGGRLLITEGAGAALGINMGAGATACAVPLGKGDKAVAIIGPLVGDRPSIEAFANDWLIEATLAGRGGLTAGAALIDCPRPFMTTGTTVPTTTPNMVNKAASPVQVRSCNPKNLV